MNTNKKKKRYGDIQLLPHNVEYSRKLDTLLHTYISGQKRAMYQITPSSEFQSDTLIKIWLKKMIWANYWLVTIWIKCSNKNPNRKITVEINEEEKEVIQDIIEIGIVEKYQSSWCLSIVVVGK